MKIEDKFYPTIGVTSKAEIIETDAGYQWRITTHIAGPDELVHKDSEIFTQKSHCTMNLLREYSYVVADQFKELCQ